MEANEIKNFRNALKNAILESFFKGKYSIAIIRNFDRMNREYTYSIEPTRNLMLSILSEIQWTAVEFGFTVDFATSYAVVNGKIVFEASFDLIKDGISILRNKAFGEASEMVINTSDGTTSSDPFAIRSAETRAIKRLVEILAPAVGTTLKVVSVKLTQYMMRVPADTNPMAFVIDQLNAFEKKFWADKAEFESHLSCVEKNINNIIEVNETKESREAKTTNEAKTTTEVKNTTGKVIIKTKDGSEKVIESNNANSPTLL